MRATRSLSRAAFEVADDHHGPAVEEGHAAGHRGVIAEGPVAMDLAEIGEECFDEVHRIGALGVPRQFGLDPGFGMAPVLDEVALICLLRVRPSYFIVSKSGGDVGEFGSGSVWSE